MTNIAARPKSSQIQRNFGYFSGSTGVTFRSRGFLVMIRLNRCSEFRRIVRVEFEADFGAQMDRRKERRLNLELPVRIWGVDRMAHPFAEVVRVRNVSNHGAVLTGMRSKIQTGEVLDVQNGASRTQFRVVWMSVLGEAGIQALELEPPILGIGLPESFDMVGTG
jgi:hypothetical protein